jgi:hypothetical protein
MRFRNVAILCRTICITCVKNSRFKSSFKSEVILIKNVHSCRIGVSLKSHTQVIDQVRTRIWLAELRAHTGIEPMYGLASRLDPKSVWMDQEGGRHQTKWYRYLRGTSIPRAELTSKVKSILPSLSFDIHHPMWTLMRNPNISQRSIDRLITKMSHLWQTTLLNLKRDNFDFRRICLNLVAQYNLASFSYLDALLLFELARRHDSCRRAEKYENLIFVIHALPLLYIDDPVWLYQNNPQKKSTALAFVHAMQLANDYLRDIHFPSDRLVQAIAMQRVLLERHRHKHPRALNTESRKIRFLASCLGDAMDDRYAIATSAFFNKPQIYLYREYVYWAAPDNYTKPLWRKAWRDIKESPEFSHFSECLVSSKTIS